MLTCVSYDMMHFGHANSLRQAKLMGNYLVVGVHTDGAQSTPLRLFFFFQTKSSLGFALFVVPRAHLGVCRGDPYPQGAPGHDGGGAVSREQFVARKFCLAAGQGLTLGLVLRSQPALIFLCSYKMVRACKWVDEVCTLPHFLLYVFDVPAHVMLYRWWRAPPT
jgi:cytidyltransferase-like protein